MNKLLLNLYTRLPKGFKTIAKRMAQIPLDSMQDCPEMFRFYREWSSNDNLKRVPGGWIYKNNFYPDYLTAGGASFAIFHKALEVCKGTGIDVSAGYWPLPGSIPIDDARGPGQGNRIEDFQDNTLDYVFSSHCLEHIEKWGSALGRWIQKLKQGGVIFLYLPHQICEIWHPGSPFVGDGHKWIPTPDIIKKSLAENNCEILSSDDGPDAMYSFYVCGRK